MYENKTFQNETNEKWGDDHLYEIRVPSCVYGGEGSITKIEQIIQKEQAGGVIIFTDKVIKKAGLVDILIGEIEKTGTAFHIYETAVGEPSWQDVERMITDTKNCPGELMIAIGGGSVMDIAKLYSVLRNADYAVKDLLADPTAAVKKLRSVMIPTTCGTGAEATCNAIVSIPEEENKKGIVSTAMIPDYVILDSQMIRHLPQSILAATGVDALAHAVECYTSKKATPMSDTYALAAAKLIFHNLLEAYHDPENMAAKSKLMLGAYYGGIAITGSGTTAVHALSYPLGGKYHIAHGVANAILFAHIMDYNKEACEKQLAEICDVICPSLTAAEDAAKGQHVIDEIANIVKTTGIPSSLQDFGVALADLDFLIEAGSQQTRLLANNRKEMSREDIRIIYRKVLG